MALAILLLAGRSLVVLPSGELALVRTPSSTRTSMPARSSPAVLQPPESASAWERWDDGLPTFAQVLTLAVSPEQPGTLYAGTNSWPGLWVSRDGGQTWHGEGSADGSVPSNQPVFSLLWDGVRHGWWVGTTSGLHFRPASALAWQQVPDLTGPVFDLALDEAGTLYAVRSGEGLFRKGMDEPWECVHREPRALAVGVSVTAQTILLGTAGQGLWVSQDDGQSWLQARGLQGEYVSTVVVDQEDSPWFYACTRQAAYRSGDLGRSWQPLPELGERAYAVALAPDGSVYAGLEGGIARSDRGGQTWDLVGEGLPSEEAVRYLLAAEQSAGGYMLYAVAGDGVYHSTDKGGTWRRHRRGFKGAEVSALVWDSSGGMIAATSSGLYRRPHDGQAWESVAQAYQYEAFHSLACDAGSQTLYAGMGSGLLHSPDGGQTWEEVTSSLTPHSMVGVLVAPDDPNHLFIRLAFERIYESRDGGRTWRALWEGMETYHVVLSMAWSPSGELWAGTQDGLFRYDPPLGRWRREPFPLSNQSVFAIAFDREGQLQWVGATAGLWCRTEGSSWQRCAARTIQHTVTTLAVLPGGHLYAGTRYAGLYRSCDGGRTWYQVSDIPPDSTVNALLASAQGEIVYVATDRGLFRGNDALCPPPALPAGGEAWREARGWIELAGRHIRAAAYASVRPLPAVHTLRADDALLRQARQIGFRAILQLFSWQEIEPTRGEWHWQYPDFLVQAAGHYGMDLIVRLDHPPEWALPAPMDDPAVPFDIDAYLEFVEAVAQRYQGRIRAYIIWNEPNLALEWGAPPDPGVYARLLRRSYLAIKRADPYALVVSAGLAPTNENSERAIDDRIFLERMYESGARPFFDVLGSHPYGFAYPPDDPHAEHAGLNMNRILDLRTIMEAHKDGAKPVWATEIGWTTHGTGEEAWLTLSPEEQADFLVQAWWKVQNDFPWVDLFTVWNLSAGLPEGDEKAGFSLVYRDGTPKPACQALRDAFAATGIGRGGLDAWYLLDLLLPAASSVAILAQDEEVHLGDSE